MPLVAPWHVHTCDDPGSSLPASLPPAMCAPSPIRGELLGEREVVRPLASRFLHVTPPCGHQLILSGGTLSL